MRIPLFDCFLPSEMIFAVCLIWLPYSAYSRFVTINQRQTNDDDDDALVAAKFSRFWTHSGRSLMSLVLCQSFVTRTDATPRGSDNCHLGFYSGGSLVPCERARLVRWLQMKCACSRRFGQVDKFYGRGDTLLINQFKLLAFCRPSGFERIAWK